MIVPFKVMSKQACLELLTSVSCQTNGITVSQPCKSHMQRILYSRPLADLACVRINVGVLAPQLETARPQRSAPATRESRSVVDSTPRSTMWSESRAGFDGIASGARSTQRMLQHSPPSEHVAPNGALETARPQRTAPALPHARVDHHTRKETGRGIHVQSSHHTRRARGERVWAIKTSPLNSQ